ncbi:MAG: hypothetical protein H0V44_02450 [Planctomycetes bacterium]|nr:hypothetical protein [Planctomycetota bacterium]
MNEGAFNRPSLKDFCQLLGVVALMSCVLVVVAPIDIPATPEAPSNQALSFTDVPLAEAIHLFYNGAIFVDTRDEQQFREGAVQGAVNIPSENIATTSDVMTQLSQSSSIVVYCSSQECGRAVTIARTLARSKMPPIYVYLPGWREWSSCHLPTTIPP